jgi:acyl carrier protein
MPHPTDSELLGLIAESIEVDVASLSTETKIAAVEDWNSLGWLTIMALLDERYGVQLGAQQVRSFETARDVIDAIQAKVGATQS